MSQGQTAVYPLRLFLSLLLLVGAEQQCLAARPLLVFLIDGFRYDYMDDLYALPGFRELVDNGVKVDYMTPDFPSLSYPNYYTLMTGNLSICLSNVFFLLHTFFLKYMSAVCILHLYDYDSELCQLLILNYVNQVFFHTSVQFVPQELFPPMYTTNQKH